MATERPVKFWLVPVVQLPGVRFTLKLALSARSARYSVPAGFDPAVQLAVTETSVTAENAPAVGGRARVAVVGKVSNGEAEPLCPMALTRK